MSRCPNCGAARSPDVEWCGQCYVRYDAPRDRSPAQTVLMVMRGRRGPDTEQGLTFPWWMRVIITGGVLGGGLVLIFGFSPWWELGRALWALATILLVVYTSVGAVLAARMWAPDTFASEERIVMLDRGAIRDVERRQQALIQPDDAEVPRLTQRS
jgi:hypothetical protein